MTPEQFCIWLQGYSDLAGKAPNADQWQVIQEFLDRVFVNVQIRHSVKRPDQIWDVPTGVTC